MLSTVSVDGPSRKRRGRTPKEKPVNKKEPAEFEEKIFVEYLSSDKLQEVILAKKVEEELKFLKTVTKIIKRIRNEYNIRNI